MRKPTAVLPPPAVAVTATSAATFGGLGLAVIGSIGPWITSPLISRSGLDGDGRWTIALAVIAAFILARRGAPDIRAGIPCVAILGLGIYEAIHTHQVVAKVVFNGVQFAHVGWGVYAVIAGALVTLAAMFMHEWNR